MSSSYREASKLNPIEMIALGYIGFYKPIFRKKRISLDFYLTEERSARKTLTLVIMQTEIKDIQDINPGFFAFSALSSEHVFQ